MSGFQEALRGAGGRGGGARQCFRGVRMAPRGRRCPYHPRKRRSVVVVRGRGCSPDIWRAWLFIGTGWAGLHKQRVRGVALFRSHSTILREASRGPADGTLAALDLVGSTAGASLGKNHVRLTHRAGWGWKRGSEVCRCEFTCAHGGVGAALSAVFYFSISGMRNCKTGAIIALGRKRSTLPFVQRSNCNILLYPYQYVK